MDLQGDGNNNTRGLEEVGWLAAVFRPKFEKSHHSWSVLYVFLDFLAIQQVFFESFLMKTSPLPVAFLEKRGVIFYGLPKDACNKCIMCFSIILKIFESYSLGALICFPKIDMSIC